MTEDSTRRDDEVIDLGAASVVTKGGDQIGFDEQGLRKPAGISDE